MKNLLETAKSARWLEILLLAAILCAMLALAMDGGDASTVHSGEGRMERTLEEIEGAGKVRVLLSDPQNPSGVVVLAEGADDISVMLKLQRSVQVLTGLPLESIEIIKAK